MDQYLRLTYDILCVHIFGYKPWHSYFMLLQLIIGKKKMVIRKSSNGCCLQLQYNVLHNWLFFNSIAVKFPYLVQKKLKPGQEIRRVTQLEWKTIESDLTKPFVASGLQFVPLPVSFIFFLLFFVWVEYCFMWRYFLCLICIFNFFCSF